MDLWEFLNYYLDGNITCQIYDLSLEPSKSVLFEGRAYDALKALRTVAPNYNIAPPIEVDNTGFMYIPVEANY